MSFFQYLKDKGPFLAFYLILMCFVTLMMMVSTVEYPVSYVVYTHVVSLFLVFSYIVIGYYYHRNFFQELNNFVKSDYDEFLITAPDPKNHQQKLILQVIKKIYTNQLKQLELLYNEKRDHRDFVTSWIHEIKVPIAASRLLIENSQGKTVETLVDKFEDELDKIDHYVEQALYQSRTDSFSKDYFITEVQLERVVKKSVKKYAKSFINKQIHFDMKDNQQSVHTDSKWLGFIIDQILSNSLKYTDDGGRISVWFEEDHREKRLLIQDTGIGIKPEDLHRVFEKGFTGSTGRSHTKSTGIGLYLAKQLAKKLGHDLSIQSEEGVYTRVIVHFPKVSTLHEL